VAVGRDGALYAGGEAGQVYRISADGVDVRTLGNAGGFCLGITLDKEQNIYICDCGKRALLRMTQAGKVTTIAEALDGRRFKNPNFSVFDRTITCTSAIPVSGNKPTVSCTCTGSAPAGR
jgi:gluconolactonase